MARKTQCPECDGDAFYAVVGRYIWQRHGELDVVIEEARIVRCGECGEVPADAAEAQRWKTIAWRDKIQDFDTEEDQCDKCGKPESGTGQFHRYGELWDLENLEKLCNECKLLIYGE